MGAPPPPTTAPVPPASDDIDWDDEDEKTAIFDKHSPEDIFPGTKKPLPAAGAPAIPHSAPFAPPASATQPSGLRPGPSMPPPPPPPVSGRGSVPPPPPVMPVSKPVTSRPSYPSAASRQPPPPSTSRAPAPVAAAAPIVVKQGAGKMLWFALTVLFLGIAAVGAVIMFLPSSGSIAVAVSGPGNRAIDSVQVFVDGKKQCDTSPCVANGIPVGTHFVKVQAAGYVTPGVQAVKVVRGDEAVLNLQLSAASEGTGIKVSADGAGLRLFVDGKEIGPLPQELKDLSAGEHQIKVAETNGRFEAYEEKLTVVADQMKVIGPLKLKVLRGTARIEAGVNADGAKVLLVTGNEKRQLPKLPYNVDIDTSKGYQIVATKKGFNAIAIPVTFEAGKDQKLFTVNLRKEGEAAPASGTESPVAEAAEKEETTPSAESIPTVTTPTPVAVTGGDPRKARLAAAANNTTTTTAAATPAAATPAAGQGTLNMNSIPQSAVLLDGRPQGMTPKTGVSVPAGSHQVTFSHPEFGRKTVTITVLPGRAATAAVRFP